MKQQWGIIVALVGIGALTLWDTGDSVYKVPPGTEYWSHHSEYWSHHCWDTADNPSSETTFLTMVKLSIPVMALVMVVALLLWRFLRRYKKRYKSHIQIANTNSLQS